ncbi:terpene synthase family protein [Streptomyces sp. BPTC-684]|uniref:terpene synthase family protein n=1 Tax=Streptomyces sp. BPTC-684 TaxID=3043734 RepID=UPI0024B2744E|nr:terpene synthase family protein [Streptomyces sp. BPTC-684]WHM40995.1 terpene synthase family protein [Streptomyces sp. BPTC-684]
MTSLDGAVLGALRTWAHGLDIAEDHLVGGLTMAHYVRDGTEESATGLGGGSGRLFAFAADMAFLVWLNDHIEQGELTGPGRPTVDDHVRQLAAVVLVGHDLPEEEQHWWYVTLRAAWAADRAATGPAVGRWSYAEYLDNGVDSINVPHVLSTISVLWGSGIAARRTEPDVAAAIRVLGIRQRLSNDLASLAKERLSGDPGNAVLLVERWLGPEQAARFIADELRGHDRLLTTTLARLPSDDPVAAAALAVVTGLEGAQHDLTRYGAAP